MKNLLFVLLFLLTAGVALPGYGTTLFSDDFNGSSLNSDLYSVAAGAGGTQVGGGTLKLDYIESASALVTNQGWDLCGNGTRLIEFRARNVGSSWIGLGGNLNDGLTGLTALLFIDDLVPSYRMALSTTDDVGLSGRCNTDADVYNWHTYAFKFVGTATGPSEVSYYRDGRQIASPGKPDSILTNRSINLFVNSNARSMELDWLKISDTSTFTNLGSITGKVTEFYNKKPLQGVTINVGNGYTITTDSNGEYTLSVPPDTYTLSASAEGYFTQTLPVGITIDPFGSATLDISLKPTQNPGILSGIITDKQTGVGIGDSSILINGIYQIYSDGQGRFTVQLTPGEYTLRINSQGYDSSDVTADVTSNQILVVNTSLNKDITNELYDDFDYLDNSTWSVTGFPSVDAGTLIMQNGDQIITNSYQVPISTISLRARWLVDPSTAHVAFGFLFGYNSTLAPQFNFGNTFTARNTDGSYISNLDIDKKFSYTDWHEYTIAGLYNEIVFSIDGIYVSSLPQTYLSDWLYAGISVSGGSGNVLEVDWFKIDNEHTGGSMLSAENPVLYDQFNEFGLNTAAFVPDIQTKASIAGGFLTLDSSSSIPGFTSIPQFTPSAGDAYISDIRLKLKSTDSSGAWWGLKGSNMAIGFTVMNGSLAADISGTTQSISSRIDTTKWHTYGIRCTNQGVTFYVDGTDMFDKTGVSVGTVNYSASVPDGKTGYVDWIRIYKESPTTPATVLATIYGQITDSSNGSPVAGALVDIGDGARVYTDSNGEYVIPINSGTFGMVITEPSHSKYSIWDIVVTDYASVQNDIALFPMQPQGSLNGLVVDSSNNLPLIGALIQTSNGDAVVTDQYGKFSIPIDPGTIRVDISCMGHSPSLNNIVTINSGQSTIMNMVLNPSVTQSFFDHFDNGFNTDTYDSSGNSQNQMYVENSYISLQNFSYCITNQKFDIPGNTVQMRLRYGSAPAGPRIAWGFMGYQSYNADNPAFQYTTGLYATDFSGNQVSITLPTGFDFTQWHIYGIMANTSESVFFIDGQRVASLPAKVRQKSVGIQALYGTDRVDVDWIKVTNEYLFPQTNAITMTSPNDLIRKGWNLISLPAVPSQNTGDNVITVLNGIDMANASLQAWDNNQTGGGYKIYKLNWNGPLVTGEAYWLVESSSKGISYAALPNTSDMKIITIPAHTSVPYWIMIGHPFTNKIAPASVNIEVDGVTKNWADAVAAGWIEAVAQGFDNSTQGYFSVGLQTNPAVNRYAFEPWFGYWMLVKTKSEIQIQIPSSPAVN